MLILAQDKMGFRLLEAEFNGTHFVTKDEEHISQVTSFPACMENISAVYRGDKLRKVEEVWTPDLDAKGAMEYMEKCFLGLDIDMRIHKKMGPPLTSMLAAYVFNIVGIHEKFCEDHKKNPETIPINIGEIENEYGVQPVFLFGGMLPAPLMKQEGGEICIYKEERTGFERIVLKFMDWYLVPNNYRRFPPTCTFKMIQFLKNAEPTGAKSVTEALGPRRFMTEAGVIKQAFNIGFSIDDIIGGGS